MTTAQFEHIRLDVHEALATITLSRPAVLNAFTDTMEAELLDAFERLDNDDDVHAVVLTGAGRAFCAGMDLSASRRTFDEWTTASVGGEAAIDGDTQLRRDGGGRVALRMFDFRKPIVAAINGAAVGVGITLTLAADFRLAVPGAKIGFVFARRGLVPESCSSWFLPRLVGLQTALEWLYTGRVFSSEDALRAGLLRSLHPPDRLLDDAKALAREATTDVSLVSVALTRRMLWQMAGAQHPMIAHQIETLALNLRGLSSDAQEGIAAFVEKRPPAFPGKVSSDTPDVFASYPAPPYVPPRMS
jgi:enoyl-CoA hydratase/carnithine racemase